MCSKAGYALEVSKTHGLVMPLKPFIAYTTKSIKTQGPVTSLQPLFERDNLPGVSYNSPSSKIRGMIAGMKG